MLSWNCFHIITLYIFACFLPKGNHNFSKTSYMIMTSCLQIIPSSTSFFNWFWSGLSSTFDIILLSVRKRISLFILYRFYHHLFLCFEFSYKNLLKYSKRKTSVYLLYSLRNNTLPNTVYAFYKFFLNNILPLFPVISIYQKLSPWLITLWKLMFTIAMHFLYFH